MSTSFLKHIKIVIFPMVGGVTCAFLNVDKFIEFLQDVAFTISELYLNLQIVILSLFNKALDVVANLLKPLKPSFYGGFFYFHFNNLLILT